VREAQGEAARSGVKGQGRPLRLARKRAGGKDGGGAGKGGNATHAASGAFSGVGGRPSACLVASDWAHSRIRECAYCLANPGSPSQIDAEVRARGVWRALEAGELKLREIAEEFGCEERTVYRIGCRVRQARCRQRKREAAS
jgi:hypothetical protein